MHPDDQLMLRTKLDQRAEFYPLGFPLQITTNSPMVLRAAEESWRGWAPAFDRPPLEMRVIVHLDGPVPPQEPVYRAQRNLFTIIGDNANFGICDVERGYCFACVTPAVASSIYFRNHLLETMAYFTLDYLHITILHAGCVARNGRGVLLCGEPGAGKSCLAYACVKLGWTLLSDDFSAILRKPQGRTVIGKPERIRLRPDAFRLFPELAGAHNQVTQFGKHMFDLPTGDLPQVHTARCCQAETVVFLDRCDAGDAELMPIPTEEALARFEFDRPYWDPPIFDEHRETMRALLARGVHRLRYSNFDNAIHVLESLVS
ncbi:MAG: hypothetical protein DMG58_31895 [Acidobacteria bacterium]|nr:MAG: hypothetical protein DMG58_31895 [Acidobacteriota bacterium]